MNTSDIYKFIFHDEKLEVIFKGVFSADNYNLERNGIYIVNIDKSSLPGTHWVAYYVADGLIEFFDSYGKNGNDYKLLNGNVFNTVVLQSNFTSCGYYCLYYSFLRCRGYSLCNIAASLKRNDSDHYVYNIVSKHFS